MELLSAYNSDSESDEEDSKKRKSVEDPTRNGKKIKVDVPLILPKVKNGTKSSIIASLPYVQYRKIPRIFQ
jgi:hypothetical protein